MSQPFRILVVDDTPADAVPLSRALTEAGFRPVSRAMAYPPWPNRSNSRLNSVYVREPIRVEEILARDLVRLRVRDAERNHLERNAQREGLRARLSEGS